MKIAILILAIFLLSTDSNSQQRSEWTVTTLKEYCDIRFDAIATAVIKQETANEEKFRNGNEFRSSLEDQQRTFMPRTEAEGLMLALSNRVSVMEAELNKMQAVKTGGSATIAYVIAAISTIVAIAIALRKWNIKT